MMHNFDQIIDRRQSDSIKWHKYGEDVLPLWVADMDFVSPEPIMRAVHERVDHGCFGYSMDSPKLKEVISERMADLYQWHVTPDQVLLLPGLVSGLNIVSQVIGEKGDGVLVNTPVYPPFLSAPTNQDHILQTADLAMTTDKDGHLYYDVDYDAFEAAITPETRLFLLCNPHNPTGRAYSRTELMQMAEICERHDLIICSDEIHCDLLLDGAQHNPIASLDADISQRTITYIAPSKTFNIPALKCSAAIIQNPELMATMEKFMHGLIPQINVLGYSATIAAYTECHDWLASLNGYLTENRDTLVRFVDEELPGIRTTVPESTYLAWFDCRESVIQGSPFQFFLDNARIALNDGAAFGQAGEGFVRLNFGCPRDTLLQALEQMKKAMAKL